MFFYRLCFDDLTLTQSGRHPICTKMRQPICKPGGFPLAAAAILFAFCAEDLAEPLCCGLSDGFLDMVVMIHAHGLHLGYIGMAAAVGVSSRTACRELNRRGITSCHSDDYCVFRSIPWQTVNEAYRELEAAGTSRAAPPTSPGRRSPSRKPSTASPRREPTPALRKTSRAKSSLDTCQTLSSWAKTPF